MDVRGRRHALGECLPVAMPRLVRADLRCDDRGVERHADEPERRVEVVAVGVRENGELPAASARIL
jgi:hypothetical protein